MLARKSPQEWPGRIVEDGCTTFYMARGHLRSSATGHKTVVPCSRIIDSDESGWKSVSFVLRSGFHAVD